MHKGLQSHNWTQELNKLKSYANSLGFKIVIGFEDLCNFTKRTISINRNRIVRNQVYVLAHEIGHIRVRDQYSEEEEFLLAFPGYACAKHTKGNRVSKVEEEVFAWGEARNIIYELKIPMDEVAFSRVKQMCLSTYISP
jgi:hypothetical protein